MSAAVFEHSNPPPRRLTLATMSQFPVGYQPRFDFMRYYTGAPMELLAPARRASWFMIALAAMLLILSTCNGGMTLAADEADLVEQIKQVQKQQPQVFQVTPTLLRAAQVTMSAAVSLYGLLLLAFALQTRRGTLPWLIASIAGVGIGLLVIGVFVLVSIVGGPSAIIGAFAIFMLPTMLMGLSLRWLFRAISNLPAIQAYEQQQIARLRTQTANVPPSDGTDLRA